VSLSSLVAIGSLRNSNRAGDRRALEDAEQRVWNSSNGAGMGIGCSASCDRGGAALERGKNRLSLRRNLVGIAARGVAGGQVVLRTKHDCRPRYSAWL
jgi:hypothetical protein